MKKTAEELYGPIKYIIERRVRGIVVRKAIPAREVMPLAQMAEDLGFQTVGTTPSDITDCSLAIKR